MNLKEKQWFDSYWAYYIGLCVCLSQWYPGIRCDHSSGLARRILTLASDSFPRGLQQQQPSVVTSCWSACVSCLTLSRTAPRFLTNGNAPLSVFDELIEPPLATDQWLSTTPAMSSGSFLTPGSWLTVGPPTPPPPPDIRVNDISVSAQGKDPTAGGSQPSPESAKRQWRRSSWCPEQERKKEEKQEYQRCLAVSGRRWFVVCMSSTECRKEAKIAIYDDLTLVRRPLSSKPTRIFTGGPTVSSIQGHVFGPYRIGLHASYLRF